MRFWIAPHLAFLVQWLRILGIDIQVWDKTVSLGTKEETVVQWAPYPLPLEDIRVPQITLYASSREALLREFLEVSGIQISPANLFKRCLRCNTSLISLDQDEAREKWPALPPYVYQTQKRFNWCEYCRQLFWSGTHVRNMIRTLEEWGII